MKKMILSALLLAAAASAQAQVWPTGNPYTCDWTLGSSSGKAFVTFLYDPYDPAAIDRTGNLRTVYPNGSSLIKPFTLSWAWGSWSYNRFDYYQGSLHCDVLTANAGKDVTFSSCSNGAWQHCVQ